MESMKIILAQQNSPMGAKKRQFGEKKIMNFIKQSKKKSSISTNIVQKIKNFIKGHTKNREFCE